MGIPDNTRLYLATPPAGTATGRFVEGFSVPLQGLRFLNQNRALWRLAILPIIFNVLITGLILFVLFGIIGWFLSEMHPRITEGLSGGWWWLAVTGEAIAGLILLAICGVAAVLTWKVLSGVLCGYFHGQLAEKVERILGVDEEKLVSISWVQELIDTVLGLTLLIVVNVFLLSLNVIPLIGGVVAVVSSLTFTWYLLGVDYFGFPLSLRGVRRLDQFAFGRRNRMHNLGLGCVVFWCEFVRIIGGVVLSTAVVGAVMLRRRINPITPEGPETEETA